MRYLFLLFAAIILILLGKFVFDDHLSPHFIAEGVIIIVTMFVADLGYDLYKNWKRLWLVFKCGYLTCIDRPYDSQCHINTESK